MQIIPAKDPNRGCLVFLVRTYVCVKGGAPRSGPVCIVEFNVHIHVRTYVCVRGGRLARLASLGSLARRPCVLWSSW